MAKTINVAYVVKDYKTQENKIMQGAATVRDDGVAEIHVDGNPFKRIERAQGEWLELDHFKHEWYMAIDDIVKKKMEEKMNGGS